MIFLRKIYTKVFGFTTLDFVTGELLGIVLANFIKTLLKEYFLHSKSTNVSRET